MTRNKDFSVRRTLIDQLILRAVGGLFHRGLGERSASSPERPENGGSSCSLSLPRKLRAVNGKWCLFSESEILLSAGANLFLQGTAEGFSHFPKREGEVHDVMTVNGIDVEDFVEVGVDEFDSSNAIINNDIEDGNNHDVIDCNNTNEVDDNKNNEQ